MKDWTKYLIGLGAGAAAMHLYMNYQTDQVRESARARLASRTPGQRLTQTAVQAGRDIGLVPAQQVNGMAGHMAMPQQRAHGQRYVPQSSAPQSFYGNTGMRQSAPGNPHAPVQVPSRPRAVAPPPPAPPSANGAEGEGDYEQYSDDNMMGGQRF